MLHVNVPPSLWTTPGAEAGKAKCMWTGLGNADAPLTEDDPVDSHELVLARHRSCIVLIGLGRTAFLVIYY